MLGTKILKDNFNQELYSKCAVWCNNHPTAELCTLNETEFNNYFDELTDKRSDIISQLKEVNNGN